MNGRLTREEIRIIEETKKQGEMLHHSPNGSVRKGGRRAFTALAVLFVVMIVTAFLFRLIVGWLS